MTTEAVSVRDMLISSHGAKPRARIDVSTALFDDPNMVTDNYQQNVVLELEIEVGAEGLVVSGPVPNANIMMALYHVLWSKNLAIKYRGHAFSAR